MNCKKEHSASDYLSTEREVRLPVASTRTQDTGPEMKCSVSRGLKEEERMTSLSTLHNHLPSFKSTHDHHHSSNSFLRLLLFDLLLSTILSFFVVQTRKSSFWSEKDGKAKKDELLKALERERIKMKELVLLFAYSRVPFDSTFHYLAILLL